MSRTASVRRADAADAAPLFAALGDETRLRLVTRLCTEGPLAIAQLSAGAHVTRQAVTKHVHALADAGLVRSRKRGRSRQRVWSLDLRRLDDARRFLEGVSQQWDGALARLQAHVEE